jgi:hypothetical protein
MAKGTKTGGRKKGTKNKATAEREAGLAQIAATAKAEGITPLEVMLGAMRHAWEAEDKDAAARYAKDAAPYMHPRLAAVEHTGKDGKDLIPEHQSLDVARSVLDLLSDNMRRASATTRANGHDSSP